MILKEIIEALLAAALMAIAVEVIIHYRKQNTSKTILKNSINKAEDLLKDNLPQEALLIYNDLLNY